MKKAKAIVVCLLLTLLLCACMDKEENKIGNNDIIKDNEQVEEDSKSEMLQSFKKAYPDASILRKAEYTLEDGRNVSAFLYANPSGQGGMSTTNLCFITETMSNAVDLVGGNLDFSFVENEDSFQVLENPMRVSVMFNNKKDGKTYYYQVTYSVEDTASTIKIESELME